MDPQQASHTSHTGGDRATKGAEGAVRLVSCNAFWGHGWFAPKNPMASSRLLDALAKDVVRGTLKATKIAIAPRKPSAYILFGKDVRQKLAEEPFFKAMSAPDKMKHIAAEWSKADKAAWQSKAEAAPAPPAPTPTEPADFPKFIAIKNQGKEDAQVKAYTAAVLQGQFIDLLKAQPGEEITIEGIGKVTITEASTPKGAVNLLLKPFASLKKAVQEGDEGA